MLLEASSKSTTEMEAAAFVWGWPPTHWLRSRVTRLVTRPVFEKAVNAALFLLCVPMWLEKPRGPLTRKQLLAQDAAIASCVAIFAAEALLKVVTYGAGKYWERPGNRFEVVSMAITAALLLLDYVGLQLPKPLQILWGLRIFLIVTRCRGIRQIFKSMGKSLSSVLNITLLFGLCLCLFAILGVHLFSGIFYSCNDVTVAGQRECVGTFVPPDSDIPIAREWRNPSYTFDNIGSALDSLLMVTTLSGYSGELSLFANILKQP
jgi:hypothetical protein